MVCTFKIGDIVQAKIYDDYTVTDRGKPFKVKEIIGDRFEIEALWNGQTFYKKHIYFEKMSEEHYLHSGDKVEFVKDFSLETTVIDKGTVAKFVGYYSYGAYISYQDEIIRVSMKYIRKVHKGLLI